MQLLLGNHFPYAHGVVWSALDPDAQQYLQAVEAADGQALEEGIRLAVNDFVVGCKADDIWNAIKASCILAGARTLGGALIPLTGAAPTNFNFVSADYDRKTGLAGNGSTKYLDSNRNNNADPQNNAHLSVYVSTAGDGAYIGEIENVSAANGSQIVNTVSASSLGTRLRSTSTASTTWVTNPTGLIGLSRSGSSDYVRRLNSANATVPSASIVSSPQKSIFVFGRNFAGGILPTSGRLSFYSIGESLDLALLDARVTALITAIGVTIP